MSPYRTPINNAKMNPYRISANIEKEEESKDVTDWLDWFCNNRYIAIAAGIHVYVICPLSLIFLGIVVSCTGK